MKSSQRIILTILGFIVLFAGVLAMAYGLAQNALSQNHTTPMLTIVLIGGSVFLIITLVPLYMLKKLNKLSRKVEHDNSRFDLRRLTEHQERTIIKYD
ncbi:MAG: hypothetical protein K2Q12_03305 [Rickettsiales bacterium]|nr:hypothetical protein [Rickettsiales bacterium]